MPTSASPSPLSVVAVASCVPGSAGFDTSASRRRRKHGVPGRRSQVRAVDPFPPPAALWYDPRVRNRVATPMVVGGSLVALVAAATVASHGCSGPAPTSGRASEDDRAAQATVEAPPEQPRTRAHEPPVPPRASWTRGRRRHRELPCLGAGGRVDRCDRRAGARRDRPGGRARGVRGGARTTDLGALRAWGSSAVRGAARPTSPSSPSGPSREREAPCSASTC